MKMIKDFKKHDDFCYKSGEILLNIVYHHFFTENHQFCHFKSITTRISWRAALSGIIATEFGFVYWVYFSIWGLITFKTHEQTRQPDKGDERLVYKG